MVARGFSRRALLISLYGRIAAKRARSRRGSEIKRILVIRPDHLGDLLFATPALEEIRNAFPQAHITGAVGPWGRAMWEGNPNVDALEVIAFPGIAAKTGGNPLAPYLLLGKVASRLAREKYDLGIVLRFDHWWGAALMWAAGMPRRWGYDVPGMGGWLTDAVPYVSGRHEVEQDLRLVEAVVGAVVGVHGRTPLHMRINRVKGEPPLRPPCPTPLDKEILGGWLEASRRVVIHPGTGAANKLWTVSGWAEVADRLVEEGWSVALTGAPDEVELVQAIASASTSKPLSMVGKTAGLAQLVWVLDKAHMVLGVDSGPLHIAVALGKPTLHLYGPSDETIWGPWGDPSKHRAFRAPGTRPTMRLDVGSRELEGGVEMRGITAEMVMDQVKQLERIAEREQAIKMQESTTQTDRRDC